PDGDRIPRVGHGDRHRAQGPGPAVPGLPAGGRPAQAAPGWDRPGAAPEPETGRTARRADHPPERVRQRQHVHPGPGGGVAVGARILILEDKPANLELMTYLLS